MKKIIISTYLPILVLLLSSSTNKNKVKDEEKLKSLKFEINIIENDKNEKKPSKWLSEKDNKNNKAPEKKSSFIKATCTNAAGAKFHSGTPEYDTCMNTLAEKIKFKEDHKVNSDGSTKSEASFSIEFD